MKSSSHWRRSFLLALLALLISLTAAMTATFAWYIFNANAHTTKIRMAAGTSTMLEIANAPEGEYSSSVPLSSFNGRLNPVSTNNLLLGFRKVYGFVNAADTRLVARLFKPAQNADFYCTSLFLRSVGGPMDVYISGLDYEDSNKIDPISSAIRMGLVVHSPGKVVNAPNEVDLAAQQYIIEINPDAHIQNPDYNTYTGTPGHVLDLSNPNPDATAPFTPLTPSCFCQYDKSTCFATTTDSSQRICSLRPEEGDFVQVDVYIWLEGCDPDCTGDIASRAGADSTLRDVSISFVGIQRAD